MYNVNDQKTIVLFGFKTQFGGGKSTGFGMIYDNIDSLKKYDAFYRQVRVRLEGRIFVVFLVDRST